MFECQLILRGKANMKRVQQFECGMEQLTKGHKLDDFNYPFRYVVVLEIQ